MSKNIDQVFTANPITSNASTDLMYFGQSPYGVGNDAAMTYANFSAQFGAPYTAAALTAANDTNVTLTLGGTPTTALLHAASITAGWTGTLAVGRGGLGIGTIPTNGQIPIGNGTNYTAATLTASTGIFITNASGSITIGVTGSGNWVDQTSSTVTMGANTGYTVDNGASLVTLTLPTAANLGDFIEINGFSAGGWKIAQAAGQQIHYGSSATTSGTGGSLASTNQYDSVRLRCAVAGASVWVVVASQTSGLTVV